MKKNEYWKGVRAKLMARWPAFRALPEYTKSFFSHHGTLPDDYLPNAEEGRGCSETYMYHRMLDVADTPAFQSAVYEAYKTYVLTLGESISEHGADKCFCGLLPKQREELTVQSEQAVWDSMIGEKRAERLSHLCNYYIKTSLCHRDTVVNNQGTYREDVIKGIEHVITKFAREMSFLGLEGIVRSIKEDDSYRNADCAPIRDQLMPVLLGPMFAHARTFAHWEFLFKMVQVQSESIYVLYKMSDKAKTVGQYAKLSRFARGIDVPIVAESARVCWEEACRKLKPEQLLDLEDEVILDYTVVERIALEKCD